MYFIIKLSAAEKKGKAHLNPPAETWNHARCLLQLCQNGISLIHPITFLTHLRKSVLRLGTPPPPQPHNDLGISKENILKCSLLISVFVVRLCVHGFQCRMYFSIMWFFVRNESFWSFVPLFKKSLIGCFCRERDLVVGSLSFPETGACSEVFKVERFCWVRIKRLCRVEEGLPRARRTALNHFDSDDVPVMKVGLYFCSNLGKLRLKHGGTESWPQALSGSLPSVPCICGSRVKCVSGSCWVSP